MSFATRKENCNLRHNGTLDVNLHIEMIIATRFNATEVAFGLFLAVGRDRFKSTLLFNSELNKLQNSALRSEKTDSGFPTAIHTQIRLAAKLDATNGN